MGKLMVHSRQLMFNGAIMAMGVEYGTMVKW